MSVVYDVVLVLHFVGLASLLGGWMVQMSGREPRVVNAAMLHGALVQLVTGVIMVGMGSAIDSLDSPNNAKIGVKLVLALIIAVLAFANRRRGEVKPGVFFGIGALTLINVGIAVFW